MKTIGKYIGALLCAALLLLGMAACSSSCKEKGCDEEVYKDGYCELHYYAHQLGDALGGLF